MIFYPKEFISSENIYLRNSKLAIEKYRIDLLEISIYIFLFMKDFSHIFIANRDWLK
jgi:hypothetical protein